MRKELFLSIVEDVENRFPYFQLSEMQEGDKLFLQFKNILWQFVNQYSTWNGFMWWVFEDVSTNNMRMYSKFFKVVIILYHDRYLRKPTINDIYQLYMTHENKHEFPRMFGGIDCMYWGWAMCLNTWCGQLMRGDQRQSTIIL